MGVFRKSRHIFAMMVMAIAVTFVAVDYAEARRGMSFGSRGARTFSAPKATNTAPKNAAPVERSMTPNTQANQPGAAQRAGTTQQAAGAQKRGLFGGGFLGSMLGGLMLGGLIGMLMGTGFGGFGGILQILLLGIGVMFLIRFLRSRQQPQAAAGPQGYAPQQNEPFSFNDAGSNQQQGGQQAQGRGFSMPNIGGAATAQAEPQPQQEAYNAEPVFSTQADDEIGLTPADFDAFEEMLAKVWKAYGEENYGAIRELTTPEIMGFFAEELGQAASKGLINEVRDVKLLQGDLSEAWREGDAEYASVAMRYESIDVMRERATNKVVEGNADIPQEVTEIWTFVRQGGEPWKLSAIQQAG
ncbi:hypothetical protein E1162_17290 [Rhodobacteraceae bacterium RKSG542]|uniref:TIM44-like domain-containing protein n=1 Tax=Pseudovibrio flavus TaxID=2529854 RepID=UPI0012BBE059|nr:Tim44 domain-containing protein [Pseudovibrio flavus]MTI18999.1 hypothetical protein [Pseudovibrio flavus]